MTKTIRPNPTTFDGHTDLDVRISSSTGKDLADEIAHSVEHSQLFIQTTLPDRLIVTQKQFVSLQPYTEEMYHTEDRMYVTPLNVMEVVIDRDIDTVDEVEEVMQDTDDLKAQRATEATPPSKDNEDEPPTGLLIHTLPDTPKK